MEAIRLYLEKFKDWQPAGTDLKKALQGLIKERWGVEVPNDDIRLSGFTVYLKINPILRGEILMRQEEIIAELVEKLGKKSPKKLI